MTAVQRPAGAQRARLPVATFALAVKEELCGLPLPGPAGAARRHGRPTAAGAELHGLIRAAGSLLVAGAGGAAPSVACEIRCERAVVARRTHRLFRAAAGLRPILAVRRAPGRAGGRFVCRVPQARPALQALGVLDRGGRRRPGLPAPLLSPRLAPALLRGLFLGAGSVDDPARDHHLEFQLDEGATEVVAGILTALGALGLQGHLRRRRGRLVVYLKGGEAIAALLAAMGAGGALMQYEEQRIRGEVRGRVNRLVNADTANLSKAATAGLRQQQDLLPLRASGLLDRLAPDLQAVARARLGHPEASLRELGEMCDPPLSKSAVQRRVAALRRLARAAR